jgi:hypothetical protein
MTQQLSGTAQWKGSHKTEDLVRKQIAERWGDEEAGHYDPTKNCFTFQTWWKLGFVVKKGEKALRSYTVLDEIVKDENGTEQVIEKHLKNVYLFYYLQVEKRLNPLQERAGT